MIVQFGAAMLFKPTSEREPNIVITKTSAETTGKFYYGDNEPEVDQSSDLLKLENEMDEYNRLDSSEPSDETKKDWLVRAQEILLNSLSNEDVILPDNITFVNYKERFMTLLKKSPVGRVYRNSWGHHEILITRQAIDNKFKGFEVKLDPIDD